MDIEAKVTIEGTNIETYLDNKISNMLDVNNAYERIAEDVMDRLEWRTIDDIDSELDWDGNVMSVIEDNMNTITRNICEDIDWDYEISSNVDFDDIISRNLPDFSFEDELRGLMRIYSPQNPCETGRLATEIVKMAVTHLITNDVDFKNTIKKSLSDDSNAVVISTSNAVTEPIEKQISLSKDEVVEIITTSLSHVKNSHGLNYDTVNAIDSIVLLLPDELREFIITNN